MWNEDEGGLGSYTNTHASGTTGRITSGKGGVERMDASGGRIANTKVIQWLGKIIRLRRPRRNPSIDEQTGSMPMVDRGRKVITKINSPGKLRDGTLGSGFAGGVRWLINHPWIRTVTHCDDWLQRARICPRKWILILWWMCATRRPGWSFTVAARLGFRTDVDRDSVTGRWTCYCTAPHGPAYDEIVSIQETLETAGRPYNAKPDGWGTFGNGTSFLLIRRTSRTSGGVGVRKDVRNRCSDKDSMTWGFSIDTARGRNRSEEER